MAVSKDFFEYIRYQFFDLDGMTTRSMFGGVGLFCDGKMFGVISNDVTYLKVNETNKEKYLLAGSSPLKPFPHKPTVLSYFEIPVDILEDLEELVEWAKEFLAIQKKMKLK